MNREQAIAGGSVPTLLMSLAQITRDPRWFEEPFRPRRDVSIFAEPTGGLSPEAQRAVREAIAQVLDELERGTRELPPVPDEATMCELMNLCLGERVPPEYVGLAQEEMGFRDRTVRWPSPPPADRLRDYRVLVIGAGISGLCAARQLALLDIPYEIVEKNAELGGTWWDNDYPESGVDTPNHFYSYSFAPNLRWTSNYSKRAENLDYLRDVAEREGIRARIRLRTEVLAMDWQEASGHWDVRLRGPDGAERSERYDTVIAATGPISRPRLTAIKGVETFPGACFHSAHWRHDVPLEGKDVAVVGTGASAMQLLRTVAERARRVTIFQRSPQWARPPQDYHGTVSEAEIWLLEHVPYYYSWFRFGLMWRFGDGLLPSLRRDPAWPHPERAMNWRNDRHREQLTAYLKEQLAGRDDLIAKTLPSYPPYGKRILIDNGWYAALRRDNVELVTEAVDRVEGEELVTASGARYRADVIVMATGFEVSRMMGPMRIRGRGGRTLDDAWAGDDPRAYLGMAVPGFPNLFVMAGPSTGLAHGGSIYLVSECQVRYIARMLTTMIAEGVTAADVRPEVHDEYHRRMDVEHAELVWTHPGMRNWYRNAAGRVFVPMPWRMVDFWRMTHEPKLDDYRLSQAAEAA